MERGSGGGCSGGRWARTGGARGWRDAAAARLRGVGEDDQGYLVWAASGVRLQLEEAQRRGVSFEALVRARAALGDDVEVIDEAKGKRGGPAFVNVRQVE